MLIYILHDDRFYTFRLPKEVSGDYVLFDYDNDGFKRNLVNVHAEDGRWIMNSNETVRVVSNGQFVETSEIKPYGWYLLATSNEEKVLLYTLPHYQNDYIAKKVTNDCSLNIGKDSACDIIFTYDTFANKQLNLTYTNKRWYVKNLDTRLPMYVNGKKLEECYLDSCDSIFIMGLKITVCGDLFFINDTFKNVYFMSKYIVDIDPNNLPMVKNIDSSNQNYNDFYSSNDYFYKSPVFKKKINTLNLTITSPESKIKDSDSSFLMSLVPSALMSGTTLLSAFYTVKNYAQGKTDRETYITTVVMCLIMLFVGIVWPFVERFAQKIKTFVSEKSRISIYKKYLKGKKQVLEDARNEQKMSLVFNYLTLPECERVIKNREANLFSLNADQEHFLKVRLGVGKVLLDSKIDYSKPDFIKEKDKLLDLIDTTIDEYKYIDDAPYPFCLKNPIAFISDSSNYYKYMESIILQLITFHDYYNLKLVVLTSKDSKLNLLKNLNHVFDDERDIRYFAVNSQEAETISANLMRIFNSRIENKGGNVPFYLIISDNIEQYRNLKIINRVLHQQENLGFSFLCFAKKITDVPDGCSYFLNYNETEASLFKSEMEESGIVKFKPEFIPNEVNFLECIKLISNIPVKSNSEARGGGLLPEKLGFLEMYGVGNVNQLNVLDRWKSAQITNTLASPIGVDSTGNLLNLDLHEKKHGPHGLIAGMTGSGKSEFIITYILSLAVNYSPDEVQFVLIDYKGGGLAGAFENRKTGMKLPHLVGTITNLDKAEMNRTLVSIKSELQRRQRIFNEAKERLNTGTIDIYKYQGLVRDGVIEEPLSHLFIICDEFAELKQQQPDFMDELISAARIGRSLGVHLILATQKPSGVVDDQIWSNSKFKVCCRVQTAEDSKEMIKRDDAAYIKEAGRFYLQVGYDEYFVLGQSGYSGVKYVPSQTAMSKKDNAISFLTDIGEIYRNANISDKEKAMSGEIATVDLGEELTNILKYIIEVATNNGYQYHQLWLENVPETLYYDSVIQKYGIEGARFNIEPVIGEYDDPQNQRQGPVTLPITTGGNTFIAGTSGSGKNTLLSTLIYSTIINHNSDEVNLYLIDLGSEKLNKFANAPQVGGVLTIADKEKVKYLFFMLMDEQKRRQKYYAKNGGDFLSDVKNKSCPFPNIVVVIYDFDVFKEAFEDIYDEMLAPITRGCSKFGINFIITGLTTSSVSYSLENNFPQHILLNLTDQSDYQMVFDHPPIPKKNPGRGLVEINEVPYEFQTSLVFEENSEIKNLNYIMEQLNKFLNKRAREIPIVPEEVSFDVIDDYITTLHSVPLGVNVLTAQIGAFNFDNLISVITAAKNTDFMYHSNSLFRIFSSITDLKMIVLNAMSDIELNLPENIKYYNSNYKKIFPILAQNIQKYNAQNTEDRFLIFIIGFEELESHMNKLKEEDPNIPNVTELITSVQNNNFKFVLYEPAGGFRELKRGEISNIYDNTNGIWLGRGFENQNVIDSPDAYRDSVRETRDSITVVKKGNAEYLRGVK